MDSIIEKLKEYSNSGMLPMHMPGHKRNREAYGWLSGLDIGIDITEINGFDNLNCPEGFFKDIEIRAAGLFGAYKSILLVNGSTCGMLASMRAALFRGISKAGGTGNILISRGSHMSVYNATEITGANVDYIVPPVHEELGIWGSISAESVESALCESHIKGKHINTVIITSPTYEGIISDIGAISDICHKYGALLIVDEAHGAHLGFADFTGKGPMSAVSQGADIVIQSLHKTLPCLTQTALIHINKNALDMGLDISEVRRNVSIFQSSSPSYILSSSICGCIEYLENEGAIAAVRWRDALDKFYENTRQIKALDIPDFKNDSSYVFARDKSKIIISAVKANADGAYIMNTMRDSFNIELEMQSGMYALAMTGMGDTYKSIDKLSESVIAADRALHSKDIDIKGFGSNYRLPEKAMNIKEALSLSGRRVCISECAGLVSCEYIWAYPPGAPIIVPGEIISSEIYSKIKRCAISGIKLHSNRGGAPEYIYCAL